MNNIKLNNLDNLNNLDIYKDYNGNKLIHLIIIQKNKKLLSEYLSKNYQLNLVDMNGNTPYHLLLTQFYNLETFKKLINNKVCWNNKNNNNDSILTIIFKNYNIFKELISYHKIFMKKNILIGNPYNFNLICQYLKEDDILKYQDIINFSYIKHPAIFDLLKNSNIKNITLLINKLLVKNPNILKIRDEMGDNLLGKYIILNKQHLNNNNIKNNIIKLVDLGLEYDYQNPITGTSPFKFMLLYLNDRDYLFNFIKKYPINCDIIDNNGNNIGIFTIFLYQKKNLKPDKLFNFIINSCNITHKNLQGNSIKNLLNISSDKKITLENLNDLDLINVDIVNYTEFRARLDDILFYFMVLDNKYNKLHIPKFNNLSSKELDFDSNSLSLPTQLNLYLDMIPFFISYQNQNTYFIHPYLNLIINKLYQKYPNDYAIVFLSLQDEEENLHANILVYDFQNKRIIRYEPYGNTSVLDGDLDEILEEELTWNLNFKFIKPSDYISGSGLQSLSDDNNILNQKPGDFGGFCLSWCLWFIEMFIKNPEINLTDLVNKGLRKIIKNSSLVNYIRSYGNKISKDKYKIYQEIKLPKNIWSNLVFDEQNNQIIENKILQYLKKN